MDGIKVNFLPKGSIAQGAQYAKRGTKLVLTDLDKILEYCSAMPKAAGKHQNGSIYSYTSQDCVGKPDDTTNFHNGGALFLDLDYLRRSDCETIFNSFDQLAARLPWLYACQYSSSYYLNEGDSKAKCGLHLYGYSVEMNEDDYNSSVGLAYAVLAAVVLKCTGIDLRTCGIGGNKVMDTSACRLTQQFFLYHSEYKRAGYCSPMAPGFIDRKSLEVIRKEYPDLTGKNVKLTKTVTGGSVEIDAGAVNGTKHLSWQQRWMIVDALKDAGWDCDRVVELVCKIHERKNKSQKELERQIRSFYNSRQEPEAGFVALGRTLLADFGVKVTEDDGKIRIPEDKRIYDFRKEIVKFINDNTRVLIEAGTGTGKTTLINGSSEWGVQSLASELNAVVIVPYLANNKLYSSMVEVSSLEGNSVPADRPAVMVIDQAVKHWSEIKDRTIFIDESHQLFLDRSYRIKAASLLLLLKNRKDEKLVCFTATPTGEEKELGLKKLQFSNYREPIKVSVQDTDSIDLSELDFIRSVARKGNYDRIVLFDSHSAKKVYEALLVERFLVNDIAYLRSETKGTEVFNEVCDTQTLTKKITICTPVAFNGLNFNNENEKILVVGSIRKNDTTPAEVIQYIGRVRYSKVTVKLFYDSEEVDGTATVEELRDKAMSYDQIIRELNITPNPFVGLYDPELLVEDFTEAKVSVDRYRRQFTTMETVTDELNGWDYIQITLGGDRWTHETESKHGVRRLRLKKKMQENDEFIQLMEQGEDVLLYDFETDYVINYKDEWQQQLKEVLSYEGITLSGIVDMVHSKKKGVLVETVLDNIKEICRLTSISDQEWSNYMANVDAVKARLPQQYVKEFLQKHKHNVTVRNAYAGKIYRQDETVYFTDLFSELIREQENMTEEANKKRGEGGKKNAKPIKFKTPAYLPDKLKPFGGKKFSSCSEAAAAIGCSDDTITNYLRRGYCVECQ